MALTTEQLRRQATQMLEPGSFVDPMQQAIDNGYRPGSGVMYNDKFYGSLNPGRRSMDASPIDMLMQTDPEFARRYQAGEFETVMNPNRNPQSIDSGGSKGIIGLPDMKYKGDSPFGSVINDFYGSGGGRGPMTTDMVYNPFTGQHGSSSQMGEMYDFISGAYGNMQDQMTNKVVKSQDFLDKFNLYGDAMKAYNDYDFMQGITTQGPDGTAQLPGPIMQPPSLGPFDPNFVPSSPFDPVTSTGGYESSTGTAPDTTDIFGAGNNPINNPIAPMPSPITPPPTMNSSHSHDDLLQGIGKLFEQYFPQRGGTSTPSATQPVFDAVGNSAPPQVFGNMITPFGRQG